MDYKKMEMELVKMKKVNEIFQLCFEINGLEERKRKLTDNKPTVFFEFFGNVAELLIDIHETGWEPEGKVDKKFHFYLDEPFEKMKQDMESCIQYLKSLKEGVNNEHLQQVV